MANENLYPLLTNVPNRDVTPLNGDWDYIMQYGWNRKGLISNDGIKKNAFFIMRDWYEQKN